MFDNLVAYFSYKTMSRSPAPSHPLATDSRTDYPRRSSDLPKKETANMIKPPMDQPPPAQEVLSSVRARDHVRSRKSTPTPSTSASQVALTQLAVKRTESSRQFDSLSERRSESIRKRRHVDEEELRASLLEKTKENSALLQQLYTTRKELADAIRKNNVSQQKIQDMLDEKSSVLTQLQVCKKEWEEKEQEAARRIRELEAANRKKDEDLRLAQAKLRAADEKQVQMSKLLEVRTADLSGVQTFLTTTDTYSGAEIIAMTEALNAEIFQTAAFMAELLEDESMVATPQERSKNVEKYRAPLERYVHRELGERLWQHIQKHHSDMRVEPLPVQLAIQCILSRWCAYNIRYFTLGNFGDFLDKLYQRIRETETQPIAGRWRAITSAKIASFKEAVPTDVVVDSLMSVLYLCGWSAANEKSKRALLSVQHMVFTIEKMVTHLKSATKEGITTADIEIFAVANETPFSNFMDDIYAESGAIDNSRQRVLCTVGLGLRRSSVKRNDDGPAEQRTEVLLKPKVALVSALMDGSEGGVRSSPVFQKDKN